jgi:maleylacetoacetate isomerase
MIKLYGFWRSLASYRVRIALRLKNIPFEEIEVDLLSGAQFKPEFDALNPQHAVPVLEHEGHRLIQSIPIIEYLEETFPQIPLLPKDALGRARVRALAAISASDTHPLIVPRVRNFLSEGMGLDEQAKLRFIQHWFGVGSLALEAKLAREPETGGFAHGDTATMADAVIVSHVMGARMFKTDLAAAPKLTALADRCLALPAFDAGRMAQGH